MTYTVEAGEKIIDRHGQIATGDNIYSVERKALKAAKNWAEKMLKRKDVLSVWIHEFPNGAWEDDYSTQWSKYEDDLDYMVTSQ